MELILILLVILAQSGKNGKTLFDPEKLTPLLSLLGGENGALANLPFLKNLNFGNLLPENMNVSDIMNAVSAFSALSSQTGDASIPEETVPANGMPPLQPISKIADADITYALNQYFSEP